MPKKEEEKIVKMTKMLCPSCGRFSITKSNPISQCPKCHLKFLKQKPVIVKEVEI
jgi:transposase-like protein